MADDTNEGLVLKLIVSDVLCIRGKSFGEFS